MTKITIKPLGLLRLTRTSSRLLSQPIPELLLLPSLSTVFRSLRVDRLGICLEGRTNTCSKNKWRSCCQHPFPNRKHWQITLKYYSTEIEGNRNNTRPNFVYWIKTNFTNNDASSHDTGIDLVRSKVHIQGEKGGGGGRRAQQGYLLCNGRELEDVESFVIHGGTLVDVDDHAGFAAAAEEPLQVVRQLALPEGNVLQQPERRAETQGTG